MNITSKSRYALKIMMDLTEVEGGQLTHRAEIATRQGIPLDYMDQILGRLRECGLIASTRGRSGGYRLARSAGTISVLEIFTAVEDAFEPVQCLEHGLGQGCIVEHLCGARDAWGEISAAIHASLSGIVLADLVARRGKARSELGSGMAALSAFSRDVILQECRAPTKRAHGVEKQ